MSEFKGTPGPWHRDYAGIGNVWAANCKVADTANPIQEWRYRDVPDEERAANANLVAAAPDLLEALINLLACHEGEGGTKYHAGDIARAAIAKALGQ